MANDNKKPDNDNGENVEPEDPKLIYYVDKGEKKPKNIEKREE